MAQKIEFRPASELLEEDARPEAVVSRLGAEERALERHQRWLQAHESRIRALEETLQRLTAEED
jgi:ribosome assembly protein YihI (activator of Der GTPase)